MTRRIAPRPWPVGLCALLALLVAAPAVHPQSRFNASVDSPFLRDLYGTPVAAGPGELLIAVSELELVSFREDAELLDRFVQRRALEELLGDTVETQGTVRTAIDSERGRESLEPLIERALATLSLTIAQSTGLEDFAAGRTPASAVPFYVANSVWRTDRGGSGDEVFLHVAVTNRATASIGIFDGELAFVGDGRRVVEAFDCGTSFRGFAPIPARGTGTAVCHRRVRRDDSTDELPALVGRSWAGEMRVEFTARSIGFNGSVQSGIYRGSSSLRLAEHRPLGTPAQDRLRATTCEQRGACGMNVAEVLMPPLPWIAVGTLVLGFFAYSLRRATYREIPSTQAAAFAVRTFLLVACGTAAGVAFALSAAEEMRLGWFPVAAVAAVGFALGSASQLVVVSWLASAVQIAVVALGMSFDTDGWGGLAVAAIFFVATYVVVVPGLVVTILLGVAIFSSRNLRTSLNKATFAAGVAAPLVMFGWLFLQ
jgi:hypothetical protein